MLLHILTPHQMIRRKFLSFPTSYSVKKTQISLRIFLCCKVIVVLWCPRQKKKKNLGRSTAFRKENQFHWHLHRAPQWYAQSCGSMSYEHTAFVCAIPSCPKADARSPTVTLRSCVICFPSLCHMHKHDLQALCVKWRREIDDTWCEGYSASKMDGQHFTSVRDSKVKRQKNWYWNQEAQFLLPQTEKELSTERIFKCSPSVYSLLARNAPA